MVLQTAFSLPLSGGGSGSGGITFLPFIVLPLVYLGLLAFLVGSGSYVERRVGSLTPPRAAGIAAVAAGVVSMVLGLELSMPWVEAVVGSLGLLSFYPLGVAIRRRERFWTCVSLVAVASIAVAMTVVFTNTADEVIPVAFVAGLACFAVGFRVPVLATSQHPSQEV
ncbi:hypothetical protein [Haloarchaeobius sp. DFWS5]|uniref:hypothetical protein n=1 Tax=Haloarchaeobius sp. DFWS5 TaxID=3446114 RepID=UPI003EBED454